LDKKKIENLLQDVKDGKLAIDEAMSILKNLPYEDLGFAKIDTHRTLRRGFPEIVLCTGKTIEQIVEIVARFSSKSDFVMATKADKAVYEAIKKIKPDAVFYEIAQIVQIGQCEKARGDKVILVVSAGTSDIPVAEEAAITAEAMGNTVERLYDIGVAGVHRLLENKKKIFGANVLVVVAGMEGALPSVIGGLVDKPVIAVPTSVGYGSSFEGISALLGMLNSCVPGIAVMNIDNGFGAGYFAGVINQMGESK